MNFGMRIHLKSILFGKTLNFSSCFFIVNIETLRWFRSQNNVLCYRERLYKFKMLMHHAYAKIDRSVRAVDDDRLAIHFNGTFIWLIETKYNIHQR
ncbi:hypothetical protein D3C76_1280970 [compost metagenome]